VALTTAGGFEYRGAAYLFETASCRLGPGGTLTVEADGEEGGLLLTGLPCGGAGAAADLAGRSWDFRANHPSFSAAVFVGPPTRVEGDLRVVAGEVACKRFDEAAGVLYVAFRFDVQTSPRAPEDVAEGLAHCRAEWATARPAE
jgi:hypothetical protein